MKITTYTCIFMLLQYVLCLTNWNKLNSPQLIPAPFNTDIRGFTPYNNYVSPPLQLPWVDKIKISETWKKYLLIDKNMDILHSLIFELIVICISAIYIYSFSPFLYNVEKDKIREYLKVRTDFGKNKVFLDYVQSSSIFATIYKGIKSILFRTCHIFLILILLVLTSQNSGVLAIVYLLFALYYLYKSLDLFLDKDWNYPDAIIKFKYYIILDCTLCIIYQLPFTFLHYRENYFNSFQAFVGLESFWLDYINAWNTRAVICMVLKFCALCFIHLQENIFASDDYQKHKDELSRKGLSRKKARCMAYYFNNQRIKKAEFIKKIKDNMSLKLELIQQQLMGDKFGNVTANRNKSDYGSNKFIVNDSDSSLDIMNTNKAAPYLRKGFSCDPEKANRNQKEILRKLKFEKAEKDYDMFETFTESEQIELSKLDFLTQTFLFLRKYITNPIISCDEIDIKYAVKDFYGGAIHCQNRIERIGKKKVKSSRETKVLKGLTETRTMIFNIFKTFVYCLISHTSTIAYLFMFLNCMLTGNLISLFYPLSVLLYAIIEDPRPRSGYWNFVLIYAEIVIMFKFIIQQNALTFLIPGSYFVEIFDKYKIGFRVFDKKEYAQGLFSFIIWDILVALFVLLHQHCLVLIGLWKKRECDIETLEEAKKRIQQHRKRSRYIKRSQSFNVKKVQIEEDKSSMSDFKFKRTDLEKPDTNSNNFLNIKVSNLTKDSLQIPSLKKGTERDQTFRQPHTTHILIGNLDDNDDSDKRK